MTTIAINPSLIKDVHRSEKTPVNRSYSRVRLTPRGRFLARLAVITSLSILLLSGLRPYRLAPLLLPVLKAHDLRFLDVKSPSRKKVYNDARFEMYYILQREGMTLSQIGAVFNRDHSTILHGIQRWKEKIGE